MAALDGATLAHVAAHGRFRPDSPLFSSLEMADGPLTVHDLERLRVAPYRLILSACESGVLAPVGADELLGLASALFSIGTAGLVCSVAEVNDDATAALMLDLHDHLTRDADGGLAGALLAARRAAQGDPTRRRPPPRSSRSGCRYWVQAGGQHRSASGRGPVVERLQRDHRRRSGGRRPRVSELASSARPWDTSPDPGLPTPWVEDR